MFKCFDEKNDVMFLILSFWAKLMFWNLFWSFWQFHAFIICGIRFRFRYMKLYEMVRLNFDWHFFASFPNGKRMKNFCKNMNEPFFQWSFYIFM